MSYSYIVYPLHHRANVRPVFLFWSERPVHFLIQRYVFRYGILDLSFKVFVVKLQV